MDIERGSFPLQELTASDIELYTNVILAKRDQCTGDLHSADPETRCKASHWIVAYDTYLKDLGNKTPEETAKGIRQMCQDVAVILEAHPLGEVSQTTFECFPITHPEMTTYTEILRSHNGSKTVIDFAEHVMMLEDLKYDR